MSYEPYMASAIKAHLRPRGVFWDIGANIGLLSLFAAKVAGPLGKVISFEPAPDTFAFLQHNVSGISNIKAIQSGVGCHDGSATFGVRKSHLEGSFAQNELNLPTEMVTVPICTLDQFFEGAPPSLIKIDVEGFELEVLKGADRLLSSAHPTLIIEIHPWLLKCVGTSEEAVLSRLSEFEYATTIIHRNSNSLYTLVAEYGGS